MATDPQFAASILVGMAQVSTANSFRDGTGALVTVATGGASLGSRIEEVRVKAVGSVTAGAIRLYISDGTVTRLIDELIISSSVTPSGSTQTYSNVFRNDIRVDLPYLLLPPTWTLRASTEKAEVFNIFAFGGTF